VSQETYAGPEYDSSGSFVDKPTYDSDRSHLLDACRLQPGMRCTLRLQTQSEEPSMFACDLPVDIWSVAEDKTSVVVGMQSSETSGWILTLEVDPRTSVIIMPLSDCETAAEDIMEWGYFMYAFPEDDGNTGEGETGEDLDAELVRLVATHGLAKV
jgi:hypothetical protein